MIYLSRFDFPSVADESDSLNSIWENSRESSPTLIKMIW